MSDSPNDVIQSALSLSQSERAELALQLLQSLSPPGEELSDAEFAEQLRQRVEMYRRGEMDSADLYDARALIKKRLSEGPSR
jgi:hypothetical protein